MSAPCRLEESLSLGGSLVLLCCSSPFVWRPTCLPIHHFASFSGLIFFLYTILPLLASYLSSYSPFCVLIAYLSSYLFLPIYHFASFIGLPFSLYTILHLLAFFLSSYSPFCIFYRPTFLPIHHFAFFIGLPFFLFTFLHLLALGFSIAYLSSQTVISLLSTAYHPSCIALYRSFQSSVIGHTSGPGD